MYKSEEKFTKQSFIVNNKPDLIGSDTTETVPDTIPEGLFIISGIIWSTNSVYTYDSDNHVINRWRLYTNITRNVFVIKGLLLNIP